MGVSACDICALAQFCLFDDPDNDEFWGLVETWDLYRLMACDYPYVEKAVDAARAWKVDMVRYVHRASAL